MLARYGDRDNSPLHHYAYHTGGSSFQAFRVSRIFLSHSSTNNAEAVALRDWLAGEGWDDVFFDADPERGIAAGERWERALNQAAHRCEAVLFLVSRAWLNSAWCLKEFNLALRLNKRLFGVLIEDLPLTDLPVNLTSTWQMVQLAAGQDHLMLRVTMPITGVEAHVTFSAEGLTRLKNGLERAGLDPRFFAWPPRHDPKRPPYRGLLPLEADDAGIFFGRDASIIEALDRLHALRQGAAPRLFVILGASGAGKSSFLRAGLWPRLQRDDRNFLALPLVRPQRAAISGETGLLHSIETAVNEAGIASPRASIRTSIDNGAAGLRPLLQEIYDKALASQLAIQPGETPPVCVLPIDQGEELFLSEGAEEAARLLAIVRDLLANDTPGVLALITIRSDTYERLQSAKELEGIAQTTMSLPPMPRGSYEAVIEGPAARLRDTQRALAIEPGLTQALFADIESGGGRDALPLLAFTLERLFLEYGGSGRLTLPDYEALGRIRGSIEAAVERALNAANADPAVPKDRVARFALLRRGLIPWLAGIDPDSGAPRRRVARMSEIPAEARPLIQHLVEQRLLATDVNQDTGEATIEPAHEALLRQWGLLEGWLIEDAGLLAVLEGVKRASRDWAANNRDSAWLSHQSDRLANAKRLAVRPDLAANLDPTDRDYIAACQSAEVNAKRGRRHLLIATFISLAAVLTGLYAWAIQSSADQGQIRDAVTLPYARAQISPYVLSATKEQALRAGDSFKECAQDCPEMVVVPAGSFTMGAPATERESPGYQSEIPQHGVTFAKPFAVSKYEVTFADWDACVFYGTCNPHVSDAGWGRGRQPVINVTLDDAGTYVAWLSQMTGKTYRLLSESEYEYATRAGSTTAYPWGAYITVNGIAMANCDGCGSKWDNRQAAPVGSFAPNRFGLYDTLGNVREWTEDCAHGDYNGAPTDGSAWITGGTCDSHVVRGFSWGTSPRGLSSASRTWLATGFGVLSGTRLMMGTSGVRNELLGFRVARTLFAP